MNKNSDLMSSDGYGVRRAPAEPNAALREIGGRLKKLSYRDMNALAETLQERIGGSLAGDVKLADALLWVADKLESA